jgi:hypothetical protein
VLEGDLNALRSVLSIHDGRISIHHQSLADFLMTQECSEAFFINQMSCNTCLALSCLRLMNDGTDGHHGLKFDVFGFPSSYLSNAEVLAMDPLAIHEIPGVLLYSCQFWDEHLANANRDQELLSECQKFFYCHFLHWLEVMSLWRQL